MKTPGTDEGAQILRNFPSFPSLANAAPVRLARAFVSMGPVGSAVENLARTVMTAGRIRPVFRELAILRVAWALRSPYVFGGHALIARDVGLVLAGGQWKDGPAERFVIGAVDRLLDAGALDPATKEQLAPILPHDELIELVALVGTYRLIAMLTAAWALEAEPGCPVLPLLWPGPSLG